MFNLNFNSPYQSPSPFAMSENKDMIFKALLKFPTYTMGMINLLQVLQLFFGYEPYPGFHAKVQAMVDAEIKARQDKKQKKSS